MSLVPRELRDIILRYASLRWYIRSVYDYLKYKEYLRSAYRIIVCVKLTTLIKILRCGYAALANTNINTLIIIINTNNPFKTIQPTRLWTRTKIETIYYLGVIHTRSYQTLLQPSPTRLFELLLDYYQLNKLWNGEYHCEPNHYDKFSRLNEIGMRVVRMYFRDWSIVPPQFIKQSVFTHYTRKYRRIKLKLLYSS